MDIGVEVMSGFGFHAQAFCQNRLSFRGLRSLSASLTADTNTALCITDC